MNDSIIDKIQLNVPLSIPEALHWIGFIASKIPYKNGEGLKAERLCKEITGKIKSAKVEVPIKAVDILVRIVEQERNKGNNKLVQDIDELIVLLKGGINRKIVGMFLHGLTMDKFKEDDKGNLRTEIVVPKAKKIR